MTPVEEMKDIARQSKGDPEAAHHYADLVLCEFLIFLGYQDLINEYRNVKKWYA